MITFAEDGKVNIFTYYPYEKGACGREFFGVRSLGKCNENAEVKYSEVTNEAPLKTFQGCTLHTLASKNNPGMLVELNQIRKLGELINFTVETREENTRENLSRIFKTYPEKYHSTLEERTEKGYPLKSTLGNGTVMQFDAVVAGFSLRLFNVYNYDFIHSHDSHASCFYTGRPKPEDKWKNIFLALDTTTWFLIFSTFITYYYLAYYVQLTKENDHHWNMLLLWRCLCNVGVPTMFTTTRRQYCWALWILFSLLVTCIHQTSLTNITTKPLYKKQMKTLDDLMNNGYSLIIDEYMFKTVLGNTTKGIKKVIFKKYSLLELPDVMDMVVRSDNLYAVGAESYMSTKKWLFKDRDGKNVLKQLDEKIYSPVRAIIIYKGFPFMELFQRQWLCIVAAGFFQKDWNDFIDQHKYELLGRYNYESDILIHRALRLIEFESVFFLYGLGIALSVAVFIYELHAWKKINK